ncbi:hypothetical protein JYK02_18470 [Corallococcus macrosporus]|uniref:DUF2188 domain-containing protein n=1 Tax=Corallococcus macrosporus TaxID=35 RepID=A0ABS3DES8_9BACT|nr:hypothetical protein [Corallococcus macrosporus]MBN8229497.1 hypothetical protein [Corallococcus macrosporus]
MGSGDTVTVMCDSKGWRVEVAHEGFVRRFRYRSESQARYFAAVFELGPSVLPPKNHARRRRQPSLPLHNEVSFGEAWLHE